ncbi:MAG: hypothetical protein WAU34_03120, partial [Desulfobacterales bacterium]
PVEPVKPEKKKMVQGEGRIAGLRFKDWGKNLFTVKSLTPRILKRYFYRGVYFGKCRNHWNPVGR